MSKSLTKLWLRGLRRLVAGQAEAVRTGKPRPAAKPTRAKTVKTKIEARQRGQGGGIAARRR